MKDIHRQFLAAAVLAMGSLALHPAARAQQAPPPPDNPVDCIVKHAPVQSPLLFSDDRFWKPAAWTVTNMGIEGQATSMDSQATIHMSGKLNQESGAPRIDKFEIKSANNSKIIYITYDAGHVTPIDDQLKKQLNSMTKEQRSGFINGIVDAAEASAKLAVPQIIDGCEHANEAAPQPGPAPAAQTSAPDKSPLRVPYTGPGVPEGSQITGVPASKLGATVVEVLERGGKTDTFEIANGIQANPGMQADAFEFASQYLFRPNPPTGIVWDPNDNKRVRVQLGGGSFAQVLINNYSHYYDPLRHFDRIEDAVGDPGIFVTYNSGPYAGQSVYLQPGDFSGKWQAEVFNSQGRFAALYDERNGNSMVNGALYKGSEIPRGAPIIDQAFHDARLAADMAQADAHNIAGEKFKARSDNRLINLDDKIRRDAAKYGIPLIGYQP